MVILAPTMVIVAAILVVWLQDRDPSGERRPVEVGAGGSVVALEELSDDEAVRLGEIRRTIVANPLDSAGASALLNAFIAESNNETLRDKALVWRTALDESDVRRSYEVRWKGFTIDREAYRARFHSELEPGRPDVYIRVYHGVDGKETLVFDSSPDVVEAWSHAWTTSGREEPPKFRIDWQRGDSFRVEVWESDLLHDNTVVEYRIDGGVSIVLLSSTPTSAEGHKLHFESDFLFGE